MKHFKSAISLTLALAATGLCAPALPLRAQDAETRPAGAKSSREVARALASANPVQRREAAEELARLSAVEHLRLVEGYRMQERDARARLAFDWALYRMGRNEALFQLVRALDSPRYEQTLGYLSQLESPQPLYVFIKRTNGNTQVRLLEVLARIGDESTLEQIKPLSASLDPLIVEAAAFAEQEIRNRLADAPRIEPRRARQTGANAADDQP